MPDIWDQKWADVLGEGQREIDKQFEEYRKDTCWIPMTQSVQAQWDALRAFSPPSSKREFDQRLEAKNRLFSNWDREHIIFDVGRELRGQGGIANLLFRLNDSIVALDRSSTRLNKIMIGLTVAIAIMTGVMVWDIIARWGAH